MKSTDLYHSRHWMNYGELDLDGHNVFSMLEASGFLPLVKLNDEFYNHVLAVESDSKLQTFLDNDTSS